MKRIYIKRLFQTEMTNANGHTYPVRIVKGEYRIVRDAVDGEPANVIRRAITAEFFEGIEAKLEYDEITEKSAEAKPKSEKSKK